MAALESEGEAAQRVADELLLLGMLGPVLSPPPLTHHGGPDDGLLSVVVLTADGADQAATAAYLRQVADRFEAGAAIESDPW